MAFEKVGVEAQVKGFGPYMDKIDKMENKTSGFGSKMAGALKMGAVAGVAALGALGAASLKMGLDFEKSMAEVRTLLPDISDKTFGKMRDDLLALSKEMGIATDKAVPALYQAISAGVPKENVMEFMEIASKAAIGGVTDLETAVDGITSVTNAYGRENLNAQQAADIMFNAVKAGKTDFEQLSSSLFNVIPTAASLGISFEDVTAQLAALTAAGTPTSVATTQIRAAMVEASKGGTKLDAAIKELAGKSFPELIKEGLSMPEIFEKLRSSMPEQDFKDLFGSVEAVNAVLGVTGPNFEKTMGIMDDAANSAGAVDAAFETMEKTASRKLAKAINFIKVTMTDLGSKALPVVVKIIEKLAKIIGKKLGPSFKEWGRQLTDLLRIGRDFVRFLSAVIIDGDLMNDWLIRLPRPLQDLAVNLALVGIKLKDLLEANLALVSPLAKVIQFVLELAAAVGAKVFSDFVVIMAALLKNVIIPLAEKTRDVVSAFSGLTSGLSAGKGEMKIVKDILVLLVEAWLALLIAKKTVTLTQNFIRTGKAFIDFAKLKKNQIQNLTQLVKYKGKKFITDFKAKVQTITQSVKRIGKWITEFPAKVQTITQNAIRTGAKWVTDFAGKVQTITQKVVAPGAEAEGEKTAKGFEKGFMRGLTRLISKALPEFLGGATVALFVFVSATAVAIAAAFVAAFAAGFLGALGVAKLIGLSPEYINSFSEIGDTYGGRLSIGIFNALRTFFTKTLPRFFKKTVPFALGFLLGAFISFFTDAIPKMIEVFIRPFTEGLPLLGEAIASGLSDYAFPAIVKFFTETVPNFFTETIPKWATIAAGAAAKAFVNVSIWFEGVLKGIGQFFTKDAPGEILSGFPKIRETLKDLVTKTIRMGEWFKDVIIPDLETFFTLTMPEAVAGFFTEIIPGIAEGAAEIGKSIVEGILDGIGDLVETLFKPFKTGFEEGIDYFKGFLMIGSPSQLFAEIGSDIVAGLLEGMVTMLASIIGQLKIIGETLVNQIISGAETVWGGLTTAFATTVSTIGMWITENAQTVFDFGASLGDALLGGIKNILDFGKLLWGLVASGWVWLGSFSQQLFSLGATVGEAIWEGIKSAIGSLGDLIPFLGKIPGLSDALEGLGIEVRHAGAWNIPHDTLAQLQAGEMVLPRSQAEVVRDVIMAPQAATIPGLDRLAQVLEGRGGGDMIANVTAASQEQIAEEVAMTLRGLAFSLGRASA